MKLINFSSCKLQLVESTKKCPCCGINKLGISNKWLIFVFGLILYIAYLLLNTPTGSQSLLEQTEIRIQPANINQANQIN